MGLGRCEWSRHDQRTTRGIDGRAVRLSSAHFRSLRGKWLGEELPGRVDWTGKRAEVASLASARSAAFEERGAHLDGPLRHRKPPHRNAGCGRPLPRVCCCWCCWSMLSLSHREGEQQQQQRLFHWKGWFSRRCQGVARRYCQGVAVLPGGGSTVRGWHKVLSGGGTRYCQGVAQSTARGWHRGYCHVFVQSHANHILTLLFLVWIQIRSVGRWWRPK